MGEAARAGEMPGFVRRVTRVFRPLARSARGRQEQRGRRGGADTSWRRLTAPGPRRASRRSPAVLAARVTPRTSGRNTGVRPQGDGGISPARLGAAVRRRDRGAADGERAEYRGPSAGRPRHFARSRSRRAARRERCGRRGGSDRLEARAGVRGQPRAPGRSPAPHAAHVIDERAEHPGASARRPRHFARSRIGRAGQVTEHRPPGTGGRGRAQRHVREARRAGIGSRTWQPRMTASSGSTAR
jgi:hypothetical protein